MIKHKRQSVLAFFAGALIGICDIVLLKVEDIYISSLLFSLALAVIIKKGLPLYTGLIGSRIKRAKTNPGLQKYLVQILICNWLGCLTTFFLLLFVQPKHFFILVLGKAALKFSFSPLYILVSSLFCGICVHTAVNLKDKLILILAVMTFILCDFRHCIAEVPLLLLHFDIRSLIKFLLIVLGNSAGAGFANYFLAKK